MGQTSSLVDVCAWDEHNMHASWVLLHITENAIAFGVNSSIIVYMFYALYCNLCNRLGRPPVGNYVGGRWSELSNDILRSLLERLSIVDFHRAKIVCRNWYICSKQTSRRQKRSPWLMLFQESSDCVLYNPDEDRVYKKRKRDFSRIRFLANSGNWFLTLDSGSNLCIVDVFSDGRINLPPLHSVKGGHFTLKRIGDGEFIERVASGDLGYSNMSVVDLRGLLWVDENKEEEYTVAWFFDTGSPYIAFCKKGEDHYRTIPTRIDVPREFRGLSDMVLRGDILYVYTTRRFIRILDLSGQEGFKDVSNTNILLPFYPASPPSDDETTYDGAISSHNIAVTTSGEVLLVESIAYKATSEIPRIFRLYKTDPNPYPDELIHKPNLSVEVDSLGNEALLLDLGITVPADPTLGIQPNSIYFTRHHRLRNCKLKPSCPDICPCICVFNLDTKKLTQFPSLSDLKPKDARWFLPS
ncbi:PREDICTED: F-box protein At5g25290-like [Camelina sativa]|uniref:F-box protein At5g25290-like n=1 Tax=Camelina sativa TaxID=90675 RepID=A0ABM0VEW7_CAMSA|nr:PREDICTED: F-box protein At5g25290-like [Camelina sativa]XP_019090022.1 PREDICTED: F-box protein At5g25290-like [Camelina sativa]